MTSREEYMMTVVKMNLEDYVSSFVVDFSGRILSMCGYNIPGERIQGLIEDIDRHPTIQIVGKLTREFAFTPEELTDYQVEIYASEIIGEKSDSEEIMQMVKKRVTRFLDELAEELNPSKKDSTAAEDV